MEKQVHKLTNGWIVGFGVVFEGTLVESYCGKYLTDRKRVDYIRVRTSVSGPELKVPAHNLKFVMSHK